MRQNVSRGEGRLFVTSEGFSYENGYNSETKSRKMLPKEAKRPKQRRLGPYSKKNKIFGPKFFLTIFGLFWPFFGCFWLELYEGATFEQKVFFNFCSYSERLYKTTWHCLKFQKKVFMSRYLVFSLELHNRSFFLRRLYPPFA